MLSNFWHRWTSRFQRPKVPRFYRSQVKFRERYPDYVVGVGTYGIPIVHDWQEGATLRVGSYTSIADEVHIFLGGHHRTDWVSSYPFPAFVDEARGIEGYGGTRGDVCIGNDVWLASGCTILSGVSIGDGAVVAARSVVSRDVPPYSIVAGNPAQIVRFRFEQDVRDELLSIAWWNWPESEVRQVVNLLCSSDMAAFLAYATRRRQQADGAKG